MTPVSEEASVTNRFWAILAVVAVDFMTDSFFLRPGASRAGKIV